MPPTNTSSRLTRTSGSQLAGPLFAVASIAVATGLIYPLKRVAPVVSLGVVYLLAVLVVASFWGLWMGALTAAGSWLAFNFFHLPPVGRLTIHGSGNWVALSAFLVVALAVAVVADLARRRALEAERRRREADLAAELTRLLLGVPELSEALPVAAQRLAHAVGAASAAIELRPVAGDQRQTAFALSADGAQVATLLLPAALKAAERERVARRIVPALESILAAALHRAQLQAEVVETAALRRSDELKTAVLRSVSHDLRTPVTAILTAAAALDPATAGADNVGDVRDIVTTSATRLWRLIEKLLDLSLLQAGTIEPRVGWYSLDEVLEEAIAGLDVAPGAFNVSLGPELPAMRGDAGQLERGFVNILENAIRHSDGKPVSVRARVVGERVAVRIVDQGPGIAPNEQERIFMPFYRVNARTAEHQGSGLGLAIAKGFIELNGGSIAVESLPGQGTTFVVEFAAVAPESAAPAPAAAPLG